LWLNPGAGGILFGSTSCGAVVHVPTHSPAGVGGPIDFELQEANKRREKSNPAMGGKKINEGLSDLLRSGSLFIFFSYSFHQIPTLVFRKAETNSLYATLKNPLVEESH